MSQTRLIIIFLGLSVILGLAIWLINSLYRLFLQIGFFSPFLATLLVFLIIVLLSFAIFVFFNHYFKFYTPKNYGKTSRQGKIAGKIPANKKEAATTTLDSIKQQVKQIQDKVAQQALLGSAREIEENLARGELQVTVFGTASAGKTSLINSLIGEIVGNVEPTMGTTEEGATYRLKLGEVGREILLTDTPGILEASREGNQRARLAQQLATAADLLILVVDNDLRQSEWEPLQDLTEIGKRSLLVFNKIDLYSEEEEDIILNRLRQRVADFIPPADVIPIAANPQPVQLQSGEIIEPEPEVTALIKRLAVVLRAEGEDLLADNILLQSVRLGEEAKKIIERQRRRQADKIIERYQWIGAGVIAVTPLPVLDMLAAAAVNAQMVVEIGKVYGCELNSDRGKELAISLGKTMVSLGLVKGTVQLLARVLQTNFATYLVGKAIQAVTAAYLTRIAGKSFVEYFRQNLDWGDGGMAEVVQRQFQLSKKDEFVKSFVSDAISRAIIPLKGEQEEEFEHEWQYDEVEGVEPVEDDWDTAKIKHRDDW